MIGSFVFLRGQGYAPVRYQATNIPIDPTKCMSDCTSKETLCVDWSANVCTSVNRHGCCEPTRIVKRSVALSPCNHSCCTDRYTECVAWCIEWQTQPEHITTTTPQNVFGVCLEDCRSSARTWYGERWFRQRKTHPGVAFDVSRPTRLLHCFAMLNEPVAIALPNFTRPLPVETTYPPRVRLVDTFYTDENLGNDTRTPRLIEFH